ncbi:MAG: NUDIX hydrolase [Clostridiales bacterium]|nr:NUDIX hydrolase [Clostridiales bacterium]
MKLKNFRMTKSGNYLNNYELTYINKAGNDKVYEMVSREKYKDVNDVGKKTAGVIIAAFTNDGEEEKILLVREFRMGVNEYVYAFPAGLSDADETVEQTAARELKEETGMEISEITDVLRPAYSCTGITDEKTVVAFCKSKGNISECTFDDEDITAGLYTKEEVKTLLAEKTFSARTQAVCYLWIKGGKLYD